MDTILHDLSPSAVVQAFHANHTSLWSQLFAALPVNELRAEPGLFWIKTGIGHDIFKRGMQMFIDTTSPRGEIGEIVRDCQQNRWPFLWHLGAASGVPNGSAILEGYGMTHYETEPIMALDLLKLAEDVEINHQLSIQPVTNEEQLWQVIRLWEDGSPESAVQSWFTCYAGLCFRPESPLHTYMGTLDGKLVATSEVFFGGGVALIGGVNTLEDYRRQRIGTSITLTALQKAQKQGYRVAILSASPMGINIYRRLGFQEYGTFSTYLWHPQADFSEEG